MQRAEEFPEEGELIIGTVQTVKNYGAFVILDEYENKEWFINKGLCQGKAKGCLLGP